MVPIHIPKVVLSTVRTFQQALASAGLREAIGMELCLQDGILGYEIHDQNPRIAIAFAEHLRATPASGGPIIRRLIAPSAPSQLPKSIGGVMDPRRGSSIVARTAGE